MLLIRLVTVVVFTFTCKELANSSFVGTLPEALYTDQRATPHNW